MKTINSPREASRELGRLLSSGKINYFSGISLGTKELFVRYPEELQILKGFYYGFDVKLGEEIPIPAELALHILFQKLLNKKKEALKPFLDPDRKLSETEAFTLIGRARAIEDILDIVVALHSNFKLQEELDFPLTINCNSIVEESGETEAQKEQKPSE